MKVWLFVVSISQLIERPPGSLLPGTAAYYQLVQSICIASVLSEYGVWYRHSGQPEIDSIPESPYIKHMTTTEILEDVSNHTITHMYIGFSNIPEEMFDIAPNLKALRLERIPDIAEQINR